MDGEATALQLTGDGEDRRDARDLHAERQRILLRQRCAVIVTTVTTKTPNLCARRTRQGPDPEHAPHVIEQVGPVRQNVERYLKQMKSNGKK